MQPCGQDERDFAHPTLDGQRLRLRRSLVVLPEVIREVPVQVFSGSIGPAFQTVAVALEGLREPVRVHAGKDVHVGVVQKPSHVRVCSV